MRLLFTSTRGTGHLRPLLPYARAAQDLGHEVLVAAPEETAPMIAGAGLAHAPFDRVSDADLGAFWQDKGTLDNDQMLAVAVPEMFCGITARASTPRLAATIDAFRPDILIRESLEFAGHVLGAAHAIPTVRVNVHNGFMETHVLTLLPAAMDALRSQAGLPPVGTDSLWAEPVLSAFPARFDGAAPQGAGGAPFRIRPTPDATAAAADWTPPADRPLLYMTFGTVVGGVMAGQDALVEALAAVADLDLAVLLTTGPNIDPADLGPQPDHVTLRPYVPQDAVLPHAAAMLSHGGSGTITGGFAHGVPQAVAPLFADQPDNALRIEAAGLGLHVPEITAAAMAETLTALLARHDIARAARTVAAEIAATPGPEAAVAHLEELL